MTNKENLKTEIDKLPDSVVIKVIDFINFQKFSLGLFESDNEYLKSIPKMESSIAEGIKTDLSDCSSELE